MAKTLLCSAFFVFVAVFSFPAYSTDKEQVHTEKICSGSSLHFPRNVKISEKFYGLPGIDNVGRVSPCIYRGRQPARKGYQTLKSMGIKTVINLRAVHDERKKVESAGMKYVEIPVPMTGGVRTEKLQEIIHAMSDPSNQPVYIHCALGEDRTGIAVAAYRMDADGWSYDDAVKEMQSFGFNDVWIHLKQSLKNYAERTGKIQKP
jgi:tyrosine-protein phosphatase SIW14